MRDGTTNLLHLRALGIESKWGNSYYFLYYIFVTMFRRSKEKISCCRNHNSLKGGGDLGKKINNCTAFLYNVESMGQEVSAKDIHIDAVTSVNFKFSKGIMTLWCQWSN